MYYFKQLSEQRKKTTRDETLLRFAADKKVYNPVEMTAKYMKMINKKPFKTKKKLRNWLWWHIGLNAEKARKKLLDTK